MKIGFISLGCAKNLVDSEYLIGLFEDPYFEIETDPKKCDAILINTCGFILSAKQEAINTILEMAELKKEKLKYLIVTGCLTQRYYDDLIKEIPEVDLFIKIADYSKAHELLEELFNHKFINTYGKNRKLINGDRSAYLKISDGCDNRCAYCAIPLIRGNNKSYPIEDLVKEAKRLYDLGIRELNIVAQDTTTYGRDIYNKLALKDLLIELDKIDFKWIRILYMYPDEIEDELLDVIRASKHIIPYFDIPVQYGNDDLLKLMNRRGSVKLIEERVNKIRQMFKDVYIRTTLIVGFPGETDETFNDTIDMVKKLKFDSLGSFTYSKEEDTAAYDMPNEVDEALMNKRHNELMMIQKTIVEEKLKNKIGKHYEALIENYDGKRYIARSFESAPDDVDSCIYVDGKNLNIGDFVEIEIIGYNEYDLIAKAI
ncbi:MAG: 30S ribosomal protein S12 methylthiotransferase RimO [Erysipelotrichaceae bacterium]|nr:30S ribosomal protein S12 methylthiotransferase RimO [Erysipelotrichaceae bacterium]